MSTVHTLLLLRPNNFGFNPETKITNSFQTNIKENQLIISEKAILEFDEMVETLDSHKINLKIYKDRSEKLPDAVFMNNWISIFPDGKLITYPISTKIRRKERRNDIVNSIIEKFDITQYIDLSHYESQNLFLEGTGSVVFDYENKIAYASISARTNEVVFNDLCNKIGYKGFVFNATNIDGKPIYHTNVIMSIAKHYAIVCLESISDPLERNIIKNAIKNTGKLIIEISYKQLNNYAGNCLEVFNTDNKSKLIMSRTAFSILENNQKEIITRYSDIIDVNISIIERIGGGSARCMLTGVNC